MDCCESRLMTSRRGLLLGGASFAAWAYLPKFARAADGRDPRLIVVILRGDVEAQLHAFRRRPCGIGVGESVRPGRSP